MRQLAYFAAGFAVGYITTTKVIPTVRAKVESIDLDSAWEIFEGAEWE